MKESITLQDIVKHNNILKNKIFSFLFSVFFKNNQFVLGVTLIPGSKINKWSNVHIS